MIFIRNLQILSVFTILLPTICYAAALEPLWKPFPGQRDVGGCDADLQNLRQSYQQALLLVQAAIDAFGNIEKSKPADAKGAQTWDRQARMAKAMFDIEADPNSGIPQSQRVIENQVSKRYRTLRQLSNKPGPTKRIYCTSNFMTYFASGFKTPWGDPITSAYPNGAFAYPEFDRWKATLIARNPDEDEDPEQAQCYVKGQRVAAKTIPDADMLLWCESGLSKQPLLANADVKAGDSLPQTISNIFVHELFHVWISETMDDMNIARQDANGVVERPDGGTYGFGEGANLARLAPDDARINVDNYQVFATAMFLDQWDWATADNGGKAIEVPDIK